MKGYLYAWLGKFRSRPDYNIMAKGSSPFNQTFVCELNAPGFSYVGKGKASNKKDSQTRAAWDFCDWLVKEGKMQESELPTREVLQLLKCFKISVSVRSFENLWINK